MNVPQINTAIVTSKFTAMELDSISDAIKFARGRLSNTLAVTLRSGAEVTVTHSKLGGTVRGTVIKVKIKKADVKLDSGKIYTIPLNMLTPV